MKETENTDPAAAATHGPEELPGGYILYTVVTEYSEITCRFSPRKIKSLLKEMIADLFNKARTRSFNKARTSSADYDVTLPGPGVRRIVEIKQRSVKGLAWGKGSEKEIQEEIEFYAEEAYRMFSEVLADKLLHGPPNYIVETIAATVASLEKEGALLTRLGTAPYYKELTEALLQKFKSRWDLPGPGRHELTGKRMRAKFLAYYDILKLIASAQKNARSRRVKKELQEKAQKAAAEVKPAVITKVKEYVGQGTSPGEIAWQMATKKYFPKKEDKDYDRRILAKARRERRLAEKNKGV
jgi:hypothetical protein